MGWCFLMFWVSYHITTVEYFRLMLCSHLMILRPVVYTLYPPNLPNHLYNNNTHFPLNPPPDSQPNAQNPSIHPPLPLLLNLLRLWVGIRPLLGFQNANVMVQSRILSLIGIRTCLFEWDDVAVYLCT